MNSSKAFSQRDWLGIGMAAGVIALVFVMFHAQGNTTDVRNYGRSVFLWLAARWQESSVDMSHGWLIPIASLAIVWHRRHDLLAAPRRICAWGLPLIVLALLLHWVGAKAEQTRLSVIAFVILTWSLPLYFFGWQVARRLIFPCAYLFFCVPLNFLDSMTFPLRLTATICATALLNGLGLPVARSGSSIYSTLPGGFQFDVADPCSGLHSILALTALTAVYANLTQKGLIRQWILFGLSVPIAMVGNIVRITTVGLVAAAVGEQVAYGIYHDYSGYIVFLVGTLLMVGAGQVLKTDYREVLERWKAKWFAPMSSSSS